MKTTICFGKKYDIDRLTVDLTTAERVGRAFKHFGIYHDGGWSAIPLVSIDGRSDAESLRFGEGEYKKTEILRQCPYFEEIIDSFQCPKKRVRLMRLEPGTNIHTHTDPGDAWALGQARIHIPVITHDEVYFYVDGERVVMQPGELWYCDFSRPHSVANRGTIARVHFVLDVTVNDWMRRLFPREPLGEKLGNWNYWCRFYGKQWAGRIAHGTGLSRLRRRFRGRPTDVKAGV